MTKILVAGCGTDVGKTVVSAILTTLFQADYWKPIQCGQIEDRDSTLIFKLLAQDKHHIFPAKYSFNACLSPHHAARLEKQRIEVETIHPPHTTRPLIIESVGGILVPLTLETLSVDLFKKWDCLWVLVSRHYVGSINHTLLTIEALKQRNIPLAGLIFNGPPNPDTEQAILQTSKLPCLARLDQEPVINQTTLYKYVKKWRPLLQTLY